MLSADPVLHFPLGHQKPALGRATKQVSYFLHIRIEQYIHSVGLRTYSHLIVVKAGNLGTSLYRRVRIKRPWAGNLRTQQKRGVGAYYVFMRSRAGWFLVLSGPRILLVVVRALSIPCIIPSNFLSHDFYFFTCHQLPCESCA